MPEIPFARAKARRLSAAWPGFVAKLADTLARLEEDQYLVIELKRSHRYLQFAAQGAHGMRAETVSNAYLDKVEQLDEALTRALVDAGWQAPTGTPGEATPELDPDGSPNFYVDFPAPVDFQAVAALAVKTLAEIFLVPHPGYLEYDAGQIYGSSLDLPDLGLKRQMRAKAATGVLPVHERLLAAISEMTGLQDLSYDSDGDIGLMLGSVRGFVRLAGPLPHVRIFAFIVSDVPQSPELLARINEINAGLGHLHLFWRNEKIVAVAEVAAEPFSPEQVVWSVNDFFETTNGIDTLLQAEFGGTTALAEAMLSTSRH